MLEVGLISTIVLLIGFIIMLVWLDKDGIGLNIKLKILKGYVMTLVIGKDRRVYLDAVKVGGKSKQTCQIEINGNPYTFDPSKIYLYGNKPLLAYYEGVTMPLMIDTEKNLGYGKLTPELLNQIIITARQSGAIPQKQDSMELLKTLAIFGACAGSIGACYLIYTTSGNVDKIIPALNSIYETIKTFAVNTTIHP